MPFTGYINKAILDWTLGGAAAPTRPGARWVSFATASPTSQSAFDGPWNSRVTAAFGAAASPAGSASITNNMTLATATAAATAVGWNLWDASSGGTRLAYGTVTAAIGCKSADNISIAAGQMVIFLT